MPKSITGMTIKFTFFSKVTEPDSGVLDTGIHAVRLVTSRPVPHCSALHALGRRHPDAVSGRIKFGHDDKT